MVKKRDIGMRGIKISVILRYVTFEQPIIYLLFCLFYKNIILRPGRAVSAHFELAKSIHFLNELVASK